MIALVAVPLRYRTPQPLVLVQIGRWLFVWLLFRLLFGSGWVEACVGRSDVARPDRAALPLRNPAAADDFGLLRASVAVGDQTSAGGLCPALRNACAVFGLLAKMRVVALVPTVLLQLGIALTGNYGYFNWLALCSRFCLCRLLGLRAASQSGGGRRFRKPSASPSVASFRAASACDQHAAVFRQLGPFLWTLRFRTDVPRPIHQAMKLVAPLQAVSHYGPFASMTQSRPELVIEGSIDGADLARISVSLQTRGLAKVAALECAASAPARLADVVCGARSPK